MSNMIKRSLDLERKHVSPLGTGSIDAGFDGIRVQVLKYPDETTFKRMVYKAVTATRGNDIGSEEYDNVAVEEAFKGGLNQCLEWDTVVFEITGVSRGLTHELVRTRKASFAQQSMRHTDMGNAAIRLPQTIAESKAELTLSSNVFPLMRKFFGQRVSPHRAWRGAIELAREVYNFLLTADLPYQDARTVLPLGTETYIIAEYPLSEFINTYAYRSCYMFYPEIVYLFRLMKAELAKVAPWIDPYVVTSCEKTRPSGENAHQCTYQGWECVEGHCPLAWAKESNRVWKSTKFEN